MNSEYIPRHIVSINIDSSSLEGIDVWIHRANGKMRRHRLHSQSSGKKISEFSVARAQRAQIALALR
jgi:hypothetical protein